MSDIAFQARLDAVRARVDIAGAVKAAGVKLRGGRNLRGRCPFHGSKSDSFAVYPSGDSRQNGGYAKCWGCDWSGCVIKFTADTYGLTFKEALERLEDEVGVDGLAAAPKRTEKQARTRPQRELIDSATMGRFIWRSATRRPDAVRTYFTGPARRVPEAVLSDERLLDIRFHGLAPIVPWEVGLDGPPSSIPKAPAICALIRRPTLIDGLLRFVPIGVHVTWLSPSWDDKMARRRGDGSFYPARKMLGESLGGVVILGLRSAVPDSVDVTIEALLPAYAGEGIETVFSGMALVDAPPTAIGLATLSLTNLQGTAMLRKGGVWPLHDIRQDPERAAAVAFRHDGPVTGLIDADMAPLRGVKGRNGEWSGLPVVERLGGPIVRRAITGAERAQICAQLFVQAWRRAGCQRVPMPLRPRMGLDCSDALKEMVDV